MKILMLFLLVSTAVFISCKKEDGMTSRPVAKLMLDDAVVISKGAIFFEPGVNGGLAKIYRQTDSSYVLALESMHYQTESDLYVYLSPTAVLSSGSLKLFSTRNFADNIYYKLPAGLYNGTLRYIIIQKDPGLPPAGDATLY